MQVASVRSFSSFLPSREHYKTEPAPQESKLLLENHGSQCSAFSSASSHQAAPAGTATLLLTLKPAGLQAGRRAHGGHMEAAVTESKALFSWGTSDSPDLLGRHPLYPFSPRAVCLQPISRVLHVNTSTVGPTTRTADRHLVSNNHYLQGQKTPLCYCKESHFTVQLLKDASQL